MPTTAGERNKLRRVDNHPARILSPDLTQLSFRGARLKIISLTTGAVINPVDTFVSHEHPPLTSSSSNAKIALDANLFFTADWLHAHLKQEKSEGNFWRFPLSLSSPADEYGAHSLPRPLNYRAQV